MKCPFCVHGETEVANSRSSKNSTAVWRRRRCESCKEVFTTTEDMSYESFFVIKRNLSRKRFVYEKLFASVLIAITGGKGSDMGTDAVIARDITKNILQDLFRFKSKYVSTKDIIRVAYDNLAKEREFFAKKYAMYSEYRMKVIGNKR